MQYDIINRFPNVELSYERINHNKVQDKCKNCNLFLAIPRGKEVFAWFTYHNNQKVCVLLYLNDFISRKDRLFSNVEITSCIFDSSLCLGTIFYGTIFHYNKNKYFCVQNVHSYKGNKVDHYYFQNKLSLLHTIFNSEIKNKAYTNRQLIFGLPIMSETKNNLIDKLDTLPYKIMYIQCLYLHKHSNIYNMPYSRIYYSNNYENSPTVIFNITPSIQNDVYLLNCFHNNNLKHFYDFAFIPDYNTSVMMNKLFRIIKENDNLDLLEESDDEDEFQNVELDKFVHIDKCIPMICSFNYRFKKWVPIKVSSSNKICNLYTMQNFVKNNYVLPPSKKPS